MRVKTKEHSLTYTPFFEEVRVSMCNDNKHTFACAVNKYLQTDDERSGRPIANK